MIKIFSFVFLFGLFVNTAFTETIEMNGLISPWVTINISKDAKSFLVGLETQSDSSVFVADLVDPNGVIYIKSQNDKNPRIPHDIYALLTSRNRVMTVSKGLGSVLVPNHDDDKAIAPGKWKMRLGSHALTSQIFYSVQEKKSKKLKPITFKVFLDEESLTVGTMKAQELLSGVKNIYSRYGIEINFELNLKQYSQTLPLDLDSWIDVIQGKTESMPVIHLKRNLRAVIQKDLQGFAGCLPFFQTQYTNKHCAAVISFNDQVDVASNRFVKVIAHEIGHFFGLYHLTDELYPYGLRSDTISDTNESNESLNVMHKTSDFYDDVEFTAGQIKVMKRHPLL